MVLSTTVINAHCVILFSRYISPKSGEVIQLSSVIRRLNYVFFDKGNKIAARSVDNLRLFRKSG